MNDQDVQDDRLCIYSPYFVLLVNSLDDPEMHTLIQSNEEPYQWSLYVLSDLGRIRPIIFASVPCGGFSFMISNLIRVVLQCR